MIGGLVEYHANLLEIVLVFSASFFIGYLLILILNLAHERNRLNLFQ